MAESFLVVDQQATTAQLPNGSFGPVVRVTFRTRDNALHAIDVPAAQYNVDTVRALIEQRVAASDAIAEL